MRNKTKHKLISILIVLAIIPLTLGATYAPNDTWTEKQEQAHEIAEIARSMGLPEDHTIIKEAKGLWEDEVKAFITYYTESDAIMIAKTLRNECYGMKSTTEMACVPWIILNRVDAGCADGTIAGVVSAKYQFAYNVKTEVTEPYLSIAYDVLTRWQNEKNGQVEVGRVLPNDYYAFGGHDGHNWFRHSYNDYSVIWGYSLKSPYLD